MNIEEPGGLRPRAVGGDLRALRKARKMTLATLAQSVGRSVGWLSQVERGITEPGLDDLRRIAAALGQPVSRFFGQPAATPDEQGYVVRVKNRRRLGTRSGGVVADLLSPDLSGSFELLQVVFSPGAERTAMVNLPTEDAIYIVSGTLEIQVEERCFRIGAGDTIRFSHKPIRWRNPGEAPCVAIWVIAPPIY